MKLPGRSTFDLIRSTISAEREQHPDFNLVRDMPARIDTFELAKANRKIGAPTTRRSLSTLVVLTTKLATIAVREAARQGRNALRNELVDAASSITAPEHVHAFIDQLNSLRPDMRERPLLALALNLVTIDDKETRNLAIRAFRDGIETTSGTKADLSQEFSSLKQADHFALGGRAWRLSTPDQRERLVDILNSKSAATRDQIETDLAGVIHDDDLVDSKGMEFSAFAEQFGFKTEAGKTALNNRLNANAGQTQRSPRHAPMPIATRDGLVDAAASIGSKADVEAFTATLKRLPAHQQEKPLLALALNLVNIDDKATRSLAMQAFWNGLKAPRGTNAAIAAKWAGFEGETHETLGGRAWRLSSPDVREKLIDRMESRGIEREDVEHSLAIGMHSEDLALPHGMEFDAYAAQLGFKTQSGMNHLMLRLVENVR